MMGKPMVSFERPLWTAFHDLLRSRKGLAFVEFAMCLPMLLLAGLAGLELTNLTMAYLRVNDIAMKVADNAARVRLSIDEADMKEVFLGAKQMGAEIDFGDHGRIIVSSIEPVMDNGSPPNVVNQYLRWQRCYGAHPANSTHGIEGQGATGTAEAAGYGVTGGQKVVAAANTAVVLVEVVYDYQPIVSNRWFGSRTFRAVQSMPVRQRMDQVIKNAGALSAANRPLCSNAHTA